MARERRPHLATLMEALMLHVWEEELLVRETGSQERAACEEERPKALDGRETVHEGRRWWDR